MEKGKVRAKVNLSNVITFHAAPPSRPQSPFKAKPPHSPSSTLSEPAFRPKAKLSAGAAVVVERSSSSPGPASSTVKSITRPSSPFTQTPPSLTTRAPSSTLSALDARTPKPRALRAAHELSRQRSLTSTAGASSVTRARRGSGSFQPTPSPHLSLDGPSSTATSPPVRVKAKVSSFAKSNGSSVPHVPPIPPNSLHPASPPYATTRAIDTRPRAPTVIDVGGFISTPPSPTISAVPITIHPITTATSAANPHRYVSRFAPNPTTTTRFQSLSPPSTRDPDNDVHFRVTPKVDPAAIPLPPQSPPVSALSFSSQSSQNTQSSCASGSTAPTPGPHIIPTSGERGSPTLGSGSALDAPAELSYPNPPRRSLGGPTAYPNQLGDSDRKIKAQAKSNRKIEDLEITNRSLLAINATLEATKHKQANEIRDLRRKLRESRLMLPPPAFRAIKSSLGPEDVADDEDMDEDEDGSDEDDGGDANEHDATFSRVKGILEDLLESGRSALRAEPSDFERQSSVVKVLSAEEVRSWRGDVRDDISTTHSAPTVTDAESDEETGLQRRRLSPFRVTISEVSSETQPIGGDRAEAVMGSGEHSTGILPPITVTFS